MLLIMRRVDYNQIDMIVLPGGMPGTLNLDNHQELKKRIIEFDIDGKWIGAICAAPTILGKLALLEDRKATCYPGGEKHLLNAKLSEEKVVVDKNIITSKGPGNSGKKVLNMKWKGCVAEKGLIKLRLHIFAKFHWCCLKMNGLCVVHSKIF